MAPSAKQRSSVTSTQAKSRPTTRSGQRPTTVTNKTKGKRNTYPRTAGNNGEISKKQKTMTDYEATKALADKQLTNFETQVQHLKQFQQDPAHYHFDYTPPTQMQETTGAANGHISQMTEEDQEPNHKKNDGIADDDESIGSNSSTDTSDLVCQMKGTGQDNQILMNHVEDHPMSITPMVHQQLGETSSNGVNGQPDGDHSFSEIKPKELWQIRLVVNDAIFPHLKIIAGKSQMQVKGKVASKVMTALRIPEERKHSWWRNHYVEVRRIINQKRNNVNSEVKQAFMSK